MSGPQQKIRHAKKQENVAKMKRNIILKNRPRNVSDDQINRKEQ